MSGPLDNGVDDCAFPRESGAWFAPTSWTAIAATRQADTPEARAALSKLCEAYWQPLFDYVRRLGHTEQDARDLTQEFFLGLLDRDVIAKADRERGRFRTFLLTSLNHFLRNEWVRNRAAKRGGGQAFASLDEVSEEGQLLHEPADAETPETIYQRSWAVSLLQQAKERLGEEYAAAGKTAIFGALQEFLETATESRNYHAVAIGLSMTPNAVGVVVHRLRQRFRELIRMEVARTLINPNPAEVDSEMRLMLDTLRR